MEINPDIKAISPAELHKLLSDKAEPVLIHTLPQDQFDKRHIPNSHNACVYDVTFPDQVEAFAADKSLEVICYGSSSKSMDAATAAEKLLRLGYQRVSVLAGGLKAWLEAGFAVEGSDPDGANDGETGFQLENGTYSVDFENSVIEWIGRNPNTRHYGTIEIIDGAITVAGSDIQGAFDIDMRSIKNINLEGDELQPVLVDHLLSDDFFFVSLFPKAVFTIKSARQVPETASSAPNFEVKGILELRGIHEELQFPATVNRLESGIIAAEAHFDIDRTRWKVIYGSSRFFEHLGMHLVFDLISFQLKIVAKKGIGDASS